MNHISGSKAGVAGVYNRAPYLPEKREALKRWGAYVTGLVGAPLSQHHKKSAETQLKLDPQHSAGQSTRRHCESCVSTENELDVLRYRLVAPDFDLLQLGVHVRRKAR